MWDGRPTSRPSLWASAHLIDAEAGPEAAIPLKEIHEGPVLIGNDLISQPRELSGRAVHPPGVHAGQVIASTPLSTIRWRWLSEPRM